jgi:hypothetical protein
MGSPANLAGSVAATHEQAERAASVPLEFLALRERMHRRLCEQVDGDFFPHWRMEPSPLVLLSWEVENVFVAALAFHSAVEAILDAWWEGDPGVCSYFDRYEAFRELISKPGMTWQAWGRLDMLISSDGTPIFIETNAAMASGGLPNHYLAQAFADGAQGTLRPDGVRGALPQFDEAAAGRLVRRREDRDAPEDGVFAILVDENRKFHESRMLETTLRLAGREGIMIGDVAEVIVGDGGPQLAGAPIRTTFSKFRLFGQEHSWTSAAFVRNRPFLEALAQGNSLPINCLAAQTVGEDKGIIAALRDPRNRHLLGDDEAEAVERHTVPTCPCEEGAVVVCRNGEEDLRAVLLSEQRNWLVKPRNDYRGSGVTSGRTVSPDEWNATLERCFAEPGCWVAQERVDDLPLRAAVRVEETVQMVPLRLASGVYMIDGSPYGFVARAGQGEVINGITGAHMLPIWVRDDGEGSPVEEGVGL